MECKYKNAKIRIYGTVNQETLKQAAEVFLKKAERTKNEKKT